jgi:hypothetical protein
MWNLISVHLEIILLSVQDRSTIYAKRIIGSEIVFAAPDGTLSLLRLKWKLDLVRLAIELISMQDRCAVCAKCTTGSEIILDAPDGTPR